MTSFPVSDSMKILDAKPLNELVTEVTVKVCYISETPNRNRTVINRAVGEEIAATLPGAPVVGLFDENTDDFVEHSEEMQISDNKITFKDLTRPYGFVSPIDKPWFQDFMEDGVLRTYLLCKAFLWTRQYEEAKKIPGKGQSMELNSHDYAGYYNDDVYIFTHAVSDKLCILGDKYEPCFEGAGFMTKYAKFYNDLADQVENIIGRRYYVLDDKLVEKTNTPEVVENVDKPIAEDAITETPAQAAEPVVETPEPVVETPEAAAETVAEPTEQTTPTEAATGVEVLENTETATGLTAEQSEQSAPSEPVVEPEQLTADSENTQNTEFTVLSQKFEEAQSRIKELEAALQSSTEQINTLNDTITSYTQAIQQYENEKKESLFSQYALLLTEEELNSIKKDSSELSYQEVESKLALAFTRKELNKVSNSNYCLQLNIAENNLNNDNLPSYFLQALELDKKLYN